MNVAGRLAAYIYGKLWTKEELVDEIHKTLIQYGNVRYQQGCRKAIDKQNEYLKRKREKLEKQFEFIKTKYEDGLNTVS